MADDKLNEGSEEERNENAGQPDEDFGLPDLEFEELEELDFNLEDGPVEASGEEAPAPEPESIPDAGSIDMSALEGVEVPDDSGSSLQPGDLDPPESALDEGIDEVEDVLDSAQLISDRLGDDDPTSTDFSSDINYDDLIGGGDTADTSSESFEMPDFSVGDDDTTADTGSSDLSEDILAGIDSPDDLAALGFADEDEGGSDSVASVADEPAVESSLFSADGGDDDSGSSIFATDSLSSMDSDEANFEPEDKPQLPPNYKPYEYQEKSGGFAKIIVIGVLAFSLLGFGLWYIFTKMGDDASKAVAKKEVKKSEPKKVVPKKTETAKTEEDGAATGQKTSESKPAETKPKATTPAPKPKPKPQAQSAPAGEIATVESSTGRSYVIISSFIDSDLAMDYAKELSEQGKGVKVLYPKGKSKRYRVSIADYATYADAAGQLGGFKAEYGDEVWALKY